MRLLLFALGACLLQYTNQKVVPSHTQPKLEENEDLALPKQAEYWAEVAESSLLQNWPFKQRVHVVADLHGDFEISKAILTTLGVLSANETWTGGNAIVVQLGDIADRGPDAPLIYKLFWSIRAQAKAAGGSVYMLFGNHEVMNLVREVDYVSLQELKKWFNNSYSVLHAAWSPLRGPIGRNVIRNSTPTQQIGDCVFVHGGLLATFAIVSPEKLHRQFIEGVLAYRANKPNAREKYGALINGPDSPVWTRQFANIKPNSDDGCGELRKALIARKAKYQIVGHTPTVSGYVETRCGNQFIMADTGNSRWMGGHHTAITISMADELHSLQGMDIWIANRTWSQARIFYEHAAVKEAVWTDMFTDLVCFMDKNGTTQTTCPVPNVPVPKNTEL